MGDLIKKTNFGKRWKMKISTLILLDIEGSKGTIRMKKVVMPSKILWKGGIWGREVVGG
jgi:hypothetical protein